MSDTTALALRPEQLLYDWRVLEAIIALRRWGVKSDAICDLLPRVKEESV